MSPKEFAALAALFELQPITPGDLKAAKRYDSNYDWGYREARDDVRQGITVSTLLIAHRRRPGYTDGYTDGALQAMRAKLAKAERDRDEA